MTSGSFDISKVQHSQAYSFISGDKGAYLKIDWAGRPTYWREDSDGWGTRCAGRLDERMQRLLNDLRAEHNNHKYRIDYTCAVKKLESGYVEFQNQLSNSFCKRSLWKTQVFASKLFAWVFGYKNEKDMELIAPMNRSWTTHSQLYHHTLTCTAKESDLVRAGIVAPSDPEWRLDFMPIDGLRGVDATYLPLRDGETERRLLLEFNKEVWKRHAESQDADIFDTYKAMYFPGEHPVSQEKDLNS